MKEIYLDTAATTKPYPEVIDVLAKSSMDYYANPSSLHHLGFEAETAMKDSIFEIAKLLKVDSSEIVITSGATEGNNLAIIGTALSNKRRGNHLITSVVEHPAVLEVFHYLETIGFEVTYLGVDANGLIDLDELKNALTDKTILISIMHINNEIGSIQDLEIICNIVKSYNSDIITHSDLTQSMAKYIIYPSRIKLDMITASAHKFHGPKGIGFLYHNSNIKINNIIYGGGQQNNLRSGTENIPSILAMTKALEIGYANADKTLSYITEIRDYFVDELNKVKDIIEFKLAVTDMNVISPYILNVSFEPIRSEVLLHTLEDKGIYVSSGSACSSNHPGLSYVLESLHFTKDRINSSIRFSFDEFILKEDIDYVINVLTESIPKLKKFIRK